MLNTKNINELLELLNKYGLISNDKFFEFTSILGELEEKALSLARHLDYNIEVLQERNDALDSLEEKYQALADEHEALKSYYEECKEQLSE